jgi:2-polyprenyl-3-methyl-5-hydroxy-6-metoxy-1,4-benzoquinol methylase
MISRHTAARMTLTLSDHCVWSLQVTSPTQSTPTAAPAEDDDRQAQQPFDVFPDLFDQYTGMWDGIDSAFRDWLVASLPGAPGGRAVELGCGAGRHTLLLADRSSEVLAVDVADGMLEIARRDRSRPNITYERRDVLAVVPELSGRYDAVVSIHTLHHVGEPDLVLPRVRSLVAPGGVAVMADIVDPGGWTTRDFHTERAFTEARAAYGLTRDRQAALTVMGLLLHPRWLAMAAVDTPLTREQFHDAYTTEFPGVVINDELHPLMAGAVWHNTAPARP